MAQHSRLTHEDREARRAVLQDALSELSGQDPSQAALDVVRALDAYMEQEAGGELSAPREPPVADFAQRAHVDVKWLPRAVLAIAVVGTIVAGIAVSGWLAAGIIVAIWVAALIALFSVS